MVIKGWEPHQNRFDSIAEDRIGPLASGTPGEQSSDLRLEALHQASPIAPAETSFLLGEARR